MSQREARERIKKLKKLINDYRHAYHVEDKSLVSDAVNDSLKNELAEIEEQFPELKTTDSPTQRVGGEPLAKFKKVRHERAMLSLNDAFTEDDVHDWLTRLENHLKRKLEKEEFYCELKLDGLAIELRYENGMLVEGSTRGDGTIGENVTQNLKTIEAIPLNLNNQAKGKIPKKLVVRGELFLTRKEFARINKEQEKRGDKQYANPRNVAAGSIRQLDPKITASRKLDLFAYDIVTNMGVATHEEIHKFLKKLGFKTNPHNKKVTSLDEVIAFRNHWDKEKKKLDYEVDGVVVVVNSTAIFTEAGAIGKAPRAMLAYKFTAQEATTKVKEIRIQIGRTGALTPVAVMDPVMVGGVTITHATLHNKDEIERLEVKIGDTVVVSRAGDVIPKITKVIKELRIGNEKAFHFPKKCPIDGSNIVVEGAIHRCSNPECGARSRRTLRHFTSRGAMNIEGLGPKIIDRFLDEGLISDAADIFKLEAGDIAVLERFGEKSAENIVNEIAEKKIVPLERFLFALGILHIGEETAITLAREVPGLPHGEHSVGAIIKPFQKLTVEDFEKIEDIGPIVAKSLHNWFHREQNSNLLEKFDRVGVRTTNNPQPITHKLKGKTFVLTGTLTSMTRDEAKASIRKAGGDITSSVSKNTDYVVAGNDPGSKYENAKKLDVQILTENEFENLVK